MSTESLAQPFMLSNGTKHIKAKPILKWAGGKTQLLPQILPLLQPYLISGGRYFEPFVGGGAVFFALGLRRQSFLNDANQELIHTYTALRDDLNDVIDRLSHLQEEILASTQGRREKAYYAYRERYRVLQTQMQQEYPSKRGSTDIATMFIYLNKNGYNGLHRVNADGLFNVPFGRYTNPNVCDRENLLAVSHALNAANTTLMHCDFEQAIMTSVAGDVVYFDPPFLPATKTANFTSYTNLGFVEADHERLFDCVLALIARGCRVVLSEGDVPFIRELAKKHGATFAELGASPPSPKARRPSRSSGARLTVSPVRARRAVNSNGEKRGHVGELLIYGGGELQ